MTTEALGTWMPYVEQSICCAVSIYFSGQFR